MVRQFYKAIAEVSGKSVLIDSSKSLSWAYFLQQLNFCDLRIIHLERPLPYVANSWKKKKRLGEYVDRAVYMPQKSNWEIAKAWGKTIKYGKILKKHAQYYFLRYEVLVDRITETCKALELFLKEHITSTVPFKFDNNHGIGGNPIRFETITISGQSQHNTLENLNLLERGFFWMLYGVFKTIRL